MKIKEIKGIDNSSWLKSIAGNIIYALKEENPTYINDKSFNRYLSILGFSDYDNDLYFFEDDVLFKFEENKFVEKYKLKDVDFLKIVAENILFSRKKISRREYKYSLYDFDYNQLWSDSGEISINTSNGFVFKGKRFNETKIEVLDIKTGNTLWEIEANDDFKFKGNTNIIDNIMVISQVKRDNPVDKVLTIGLDIHTGQKLWQTEDGSRFNIFDDKSKKLYAFASTIFGDNGLDVLNPKTGEYKEVRFENLKADTVPHLNTIYNNKLYFSNNKIGCGIGIIDLKTKEIIEQYDFNFKEGVKIYAPQISNNKIYVLDTSNTIHVLEHKLKH